MCEHEWTIVYIEAEPIGISCEACGDTRPIGKEAEKEAAEPLLALLPGGIYRIPTGHGAEVWELMHWQVQNELNRPSYLALEFRQAAHGFID